jgi:hypothetical protein
MESKGNFIAGEEFIKEHFKKLQGKLYRPYGDENLYALALNKKDNKNPEDREAYKLLSDFFVIKEVKNLGENPKENLDKQVEQYQIYHPYTNIPNDWLPEYRIERYDNEYFVIGMYHDQEHWDWITGKNDRGSLIYNVRLDPQRDGVQVKSRLRNIKPKFAILYEEGHESDNKYHVFRIHDYAEMTQERMVLSQYSTNHGWPKGDYFIFRFDEEISIGKLNSNKFISMYHINQSANYIEDIPMFPLGSEMLK